MTGHLRQPGTCGQCILNGTTFEISKGSAVPKQCSKSVPTWSLMADGSENTVSFGNNTMHKNWPPLLGNTPKRLSTTLQCNSQQWQWNGTAWGAPQWTGHKILATCAQKNWHFCNFWMSDIDIKLVVLPQLDCQDNLKSSLKYNLKIYSHKTVTQMIHNVCIYLQEYKSMEWVIVHAQLSTDLQELYCSPRKKQLYRKEGNQNLQVDRQVKTPRLLLVCAHPWAEFLT